LFENLFQDVKQVSGLRLGKLASQRKLYYPGFAHPAPAKDISSKELEHICTYCNANNGKVKLKHKFFPI